MANSDFDLDLEIEKQKLLAVFRKRTMITGFAQSIINANLYDPSQSQKPDWYDDLIGHLEATQKQAMHWTGSVAPQMTVIPQTYMNFADSFGGQYRLLLSLMNDLIESTDNASLDADHLVQAIQTIFSKFITSARQQIAIINTSQDDMTSFLDAMRFAVGGLTEGADSVNQALTHEKDKVAAVSAAISDLQSKLQDDINSAIADSTSTLVALIGAIVTIVVAVIDPEVGAVAGAVVAGLAVGASIAGPTISSKAIVADQNAIIENQQELGNDAKQVVILNCLSLTVNGLVKAYDTNNFDISITKITETWNQMVGNMQQVSDAIVGARTDKAALKSILADIENFNETLNKVQDFGADIQQEALVAASKPINKLTIPTSAAA